MRTLLSITALAAIGVLGYLAEPSLRFQLTGASSTAVELARNKKVVLQLPSGATVDLASLPPEQLPPSVVLKAEVKAFDHAAHTTTNFEAGRQVTLVRIEGGNAVVSIDPGSFIGRAPITETDLVEQIAAKLSVAPAAAAAEPPPKTEIPQAMEPEKLAAPPEPAPAAEASLMPEAIPAADSETEPAPEMPAAPAASSKDAVEAMQESIKSAQIKEFTFEQVLEWKTAGEETLDGETYQTGLATYKAMTVFGEKNIQAKALIQGGAVKRWIWPKSGTDIK